MPQIEIGHMVVKFKNVDKENWAERTYDTKYYLFPFEISNLIRFRSVPKRK